jgi:hypothetical protein
MEFLGDRVVWNAEDIGGLCFCGKTDRRYDSVHELLCRMALKISRRIKFINLRNTGRNRKVAK